MVEDKGCKGRVRTLNKWDRGEIETGLKGQGVERGKNNCKKDRNKEDRYLRNQLLYQQFLLIIMRTFSTKLKDYLNIILPYIPCYFEKNKVKYYSDRIFPHFPRYFKICTFTAKQRQLIDAHPSEKQGGRPLPEKMGGFHSPPRPGKLGAQEEKADTFQSFNFDFKNRFKNFFCMRHHFHPKLHMVLTWLKVQFTVKKIQGGFFARGDNKFRAIFQFFPKNIVILTLTPL